MADDATAFRARAAAERANAAATTLDNVRERCDRAAATWEAMAARADRTTTMREQRGATAMAQSVDAGD